MGSKAVASLALAILAGLTACSDTSSVPQGNAADHVRDRRFGAEAAPQVMFTETGVPAWVQQAVADWRPVDPTDDMPAAVEKARVSNSCTLRRPAKGERVANVHMSSGTRGTKSSLYAFDKDDVTSRAKAWINMARKGHRPPSAERAIARSMSPIDVVVTDTKAPVYLVLQGGHSRLWNIHAAPGARIAHITVVGGRYVGVANAPEGVKVEFLTGKKAESCGATPFLKPNDRWDAVVRAKNGDSIMKEAVNMREGKYRKYSRWFKHNFGTSASHAIVGDDVVGHALVGSLPASAEQRVPYASLKSARVLVTPADYIMVETPKAFRAKTDELTKQTAEKALGTTLASVRQAAK